MNDQQTNDVQPFSNGSQFGDWTASNCASCERAASEDCNYDDMPCEIEKALTLAYLTSGRIPLEIADRMGHGNGRYGWPCLERTPPFKNVRPDGTVDRSIVEGAVSA